LERLGRPCCGTSVAESALASPGSDSVDGGTTTIEISAKRVGRIVLAAGDNAAEQIWALFDSVEGREEEG
jgi:hypothetical protein